MDNPSLLIYSISNQSFMEAVTWGLAYLFSWEIRKGVENKNMLKFLFSGISYSIWYSVLKWHSWEHNHIIPLYLDTQYVV